MAAFQSRSTVSGEAFLGHYPVVIFSQLGGLSWLQIGRDLQPTGWPFLANIRSRSTVSGEALIGYNSVEIFSQMGGLYWLLSCRDLQSDGWPLFATILSRSSVYPSSGGPLVPAVGPATDSEGQPVECRTVVENLLALPPRSVTSAVLRWAVCASEDGKLEVQLQCLPAPITSLASKPVFKR